MIIQENKYKKYNKKIQQKIQNKTNKNKTIQLKWKNKTEKLNVLNVYKSYKKNT